MSKIPESFNLDHPQPPRSIVLPVLLVLVGAIAIGSLLWNIMAFSLHASDSHVKGQVIILEQRTQELDLELKKEQEKRKEVESKVTQLNSDLKDASDLAKKTSDEAQTQLNEAMAESAKTRKALDECRQSPTELPTLSEAAVVRRAEKFSVRTQLSDRAKAAGLLDGSTAEEVKNAGRAKALLFADNSPAILLLSVDILTTDGAMVASLRLSHIEQWRVPGTDHSWLVTVSDGDLILRCDPRSPARSIASGIVQLVDNFATLRK